jgi:hypothetical protein
MWHCVAAGTVNPDADIAYLTDENKSVPEAST